MKTSFKTLLACLSIVVSSTAIAAPSFDRPCGAHTWHHIFVKGSNSWQASIHGISEAEHIKFVDRSCATVNAFNMKPGDSEQFGFIFDHHANFDVAYALTLKQQNDKQTYMSSKACVFVVTAKGPAMPDITAISYNNAKCKSKVIHGVGEDFYAE